MKDPYATEQETVDFRIGRGAAYVVVYLFLLLVTVPPLVRNIGDGFAAPRALFAKDLGQSITEHLKAAESKFEDAPFTEPARRAVQGMLTRGPLREGNAKTHIGRDGWLYFKTALDAMSGYGPLRPEPDSVAKDPNRKPWRSPLDAIARFAEQLAETDTELLLVPIPVKPMIYPEHLGIETAAPLVPPDAQPFYFAIDRLPNASVLDLSQAFWAAKADDQLFLKQDTHWTPEGMELAASLIAAEVLDRGWRQAMQQFPTAEPQTRHSRGDLVEKLDLRKPGFVDEAADAVPVLGETVSRQSPIVLLGDSFTNIYSDEVGLDWGAGAGLAQHLARRLEMPLDVVAINGGGATEVREALARRKGAASLMRDKKLVIWAIAARDLFLSESAAAGARVEWEDVTFDTRQPDPPEETGATPSRVRAKLVLKSQIDDPKKTTYTALLYAAEYELIETLSGEPPETEEGRFAVLHWAFRDREMLPSADYELDAERTLDLVSFDTQTELQTLEISNDTDFFDLLWEVEGKAEPAADAEVAGPVIGDAAPSPALPAGAALIYATVLGIGLHRSWRAGLSR